MAAGGADGPLAARPGRRAAPARGNRERSWHRFRRIPCSTRFRPWRTIPFTRRIPRCAAVAREGAAAWEGDLAAHGAWLGRAQTLAAGDEANRHPPRLISYDRGGHRVDQIEFHPSGGC